MLRTPSTAIEVIGEPYLMLGVARELLGLRTVVNPVRQTRALTMSLWEEAIEATGALVKC